MTREEAIKIVQSATVWTDEERDALAMLIPELAESEDEKIRKALVWHLKADVDFVSNGVTKAECLAYLEKQKEQLTDESFDSLFDDYCDAHPDGLTLEECGKFFFSKGFSKGKLVATNDFSLALAERYCQGLRDGQEEHWKPSEVCYGPTGDPDPAGVWKPSEEQMKAMSYFVRKHQATANHATTKWPEFEAFKSLYNDLKKLM